MNLLQLVALIIGLSALLGFINIRFLKLPSTIGLMVLALVLSLVILLAGSALPFTDEIRSILITIDFSEFLLDFMLGFLLFAGALHADLARLRRWRGPILTYATIGILISTGLVATTVYYLLPLFDIHVPFIHCLLFGALISPTDPIAVLSILKQAGISESIETKITGESLFNDGFGVVIFITLFSIASEGLGEVTAAEISILLLEEIGGGVLLGLLLGYSGFLMMKQIDHYQTEVLITLALVILGTTIAPIFHFSGPLAMVVAGLFVGNKAALHAMSDETHDYVTKFWEMIDEIMNAVLFVLIGLELLLIPFQTAFLIVGVISIVIIILARFISLVVPTKLFRFEYEFPKSTYLIMTWGGLRGGISIALALSLQEDMHRNLIVTMTYVVVLFSILVQGLTLGKFVKALEKRRLASPLK